MPGPRCHRHPVCALLLLVLAAGCADRGVAPPIVALAPESCATIAEGAPAGTEIAVVRWNEGGSTDVTADALPSHCFFQGTIDRRVGRDGVAYGLGFQLRLPEEWSGRFYFQGGYGTDGVITPALGANVGGSALAHGFAVVSTDAGHRGGGPEFGLDPDARLDYGYRAIDRVTRVSRALIARAYGREPEHSYLVGCSNGGRQGFVAAQRFPDFFDGVVAGAPGFNLPRAAIGEAWNTQAVAAIAKTFDAGGKPYLPDTFSDADLAVLAGGILGACDANDGLADGIVDDLHACRFDPGSLVCSGAKEASCLTADQVGALEKIFGGARDSRGESLYSGFPWDGGVGDPSAIASLRAWTLGSPRAPTNTALNTTLGAGVLAFIFLTPPTGIADPLQLQLDFDFDRDTPGIFATAGEYAESSVDFMSATSTDLSAFRRRGGKMIVYHGGSDGVFSADDTIRWYEALDGANGGRAADFARVFLVPGMGHCAGGPATDRFDAFSPLVDWVENGVAPEAIVASAGNGTPFPGRSRPLCPYPRQSRYSGSGSIEDAASFECR